MENCPTQNLLRLDGDNVKLDLKPEYINLVDYLLKEHGASQKSVMRILQEINTQLRFLPETALLYLSEKLDIPISTLYRIGSFYKAFSFKPRGKYIISVCSGTACHVRGSSSIVDEIEKILKIKNGETTEDGKFTLETVNCVGACALGPVIVINGNYHGHLTRDKIEPILKEYV
ncbi:MAG TPA: NAD(P)H-dependent oxidoreductase subunit E [Victivallales bacterium]|nr:NAD(P)H-dependent oxidoreductase subunit E [Victivallales bacterium]